MLSRTTNGLRMVQRAALLFTLILTTACIHTVEGENLSEAQSKENQARASVELGLAHIRNGDRQSAKRPLLHALELSPRSSEVHHALAIMYAGDLEHQLAYEHYSRALALDPGYTQARNNFGAYLHKQNLSAEAIMQLEIAAGDTLYPRRFLVFENLGRAYLSVGRYYEAEQAFLRAVNLNEGLSRSHLELAEIYFSREDFPNAYKHFKRFEALKLGPDAQGLWLGIRLERALGNNDAVASYSLQLRNLFPASEEYRLFRETTN